MQSFLFLRCLPISYTHPRQNSHGQAAPCVRHPPPASIQQEKIFGRNDVFLKYNLIFAKTIFCFDYEHNLTTGSTECVEAFLFTDPHSPSVGSCRTSDRISGEFRQGTGTGIIYRRSRQRHHPQAGHPRNGKPPRSHPAGPHGHGTAEEQRYGSRLHQRPHRNMGRRRMGESQRHDIGSRRRSGCCRQPWPYSKPKT